MAEFYEQLARQLSFPPHFGHNLDALRDVLTTDVEGALHLVWNGAASSRGAMGADFERVVTLLQKVARERKDFQVIIRD
jgi:ribonuclease inhibitor